MYINISDFLCTSNISLKDNLGYILMNSLFSKFFISKSTLYKLNSIGF